MNNNNSEYLTSGARFYVFVALFACVLMGSMPILADERQPALKGSSTLTIQVDSLMKMGDLAYGQKRYDDAIEHYMASADLSRELGQLDRMADALTNVSGTYQQLGNYEKAIRMAEQVLEIQSGLGNKADMSKTYSNIGTSHYYTGKYNLAIQEYGKSLQLRTELGDSAAMADMLLNIGSVQNASGSFELAMDNYLRSLAIREVLGDLSGMASALNNIGSIYREQGNFAKATEFFTRSLSARENAGDTLGMVSSLVNIGIVYQTQGFHSEALNRYEKALELVERNDDQMRIGVVINNIGSVYQDMGELDKAMRYFNRCSDVMQRSGNRSGYAATLSSIGNLHLTKGESREAMPYLMESLTIRKSIGDRKGAASSYIGLAKAEMMQGDMVRALSLADTALLMARELGVASGIRDAAELLHQGYRAQKRFPEALEMHELYMTMRDSIISVENQKAVMRQQFQYDMEKREALLQAEQDKKDAVAREELRRKNVERNAGLAGLGLMVVLAGVFLTQRNRISKEKDRSEKLLLNILPESTAKELKDKGYTEPRIHVNATVLFTDFKGFTELSENLSAKELVELLDKYFKAYDKIVQRHGLEKIKTIGDAYMAASGLKDSRDTNAVNAVKAALELCRVTEDLIAEREGLGKPAFRVRVGLHSGPVIAGVVGDHKFQYDIWGDTVNTASRMESSGQVGKVNISEATYALVKDDFVCEYRGEVEAKGKGKMGMYFVKSQI